MKNILILQNIIPHYRKALYNELSKYYNVTVLHSGEKFIDNKDKYKEIIVQNYKVWKFNFQTQILQEVNSNKYDVIIAMFDLTWVNNILAMYLKNKNTKFIWWGSWLTKNNLANKIRLLIMKKGFNNILYSQKAKEEFIKNGIEEDILYVANNTFDIGKRIKSFEYQKSIILFVGSLDKRKQLDIVIKSYNHIQKKFLNEIKFIIIGDGIEKNNLKLLIKKLYLEDKIILKGKITDTKLLKEYYKKAIVSVSFGQAGLSVLQSLGFGVSFLTKRNAISGGEITNIKDGFNGILCEDSIESLEEKLLYLCKNITYARQLGKNAYDYYSEHCTMQNMVNGFIKAIEK